MGNNLSPKIGFILLFTVLLVIFTTSLCRQVLAHPLDQTLLKVFVATDTNHSPLPENTALLELHITWQQISYIHEIGEDGVQNSEVNVFKENAFDAHMKRIYAEPKKHRDYILDNIEIKASDEDCDIKNLQEKKYNKEEVLMGSGVTILGEVVCPTDPKIKLQVLNRMFFEDFPYQNNNNEIYLYGRLVSSGVVSNNNPYILYPSPTPELPSISLNTKNPESLVNKLSGIFLNSISNPSGYTAIILFLIGFLHSLETGHFKTIAALSMSQSESFKKTLLTVVVFVVTHVADIFILTTGLFIFSPWINKYKLASTLEQYAIFSILIISGYQIYRWWKLQRKDKRSLGKESDHHDNHLSYNRSFKNQILLAFLSGLAPCAMGWTVFTLILSTGKLSLVFLYLSIFAAGIATAVLTIAILAKTIGMKITKKWKNFEKLAPLLSYLLVFLIAIFRIAGGVK